jgi:beta-glucanase (GH16 family)
MEALNRAKDVAVRTISRALIAISLCVACADDASVQDDSAQKADTGTAVREDAAAPKDAATEDAATAKDAAPKLDAADEQDASHPNDAATGDASASDAGLAGWKLVWSDEFDGAKGSLPDATKWVMETGGHGFGNNQLEFDTDRADNASTDGEGKLVITAKAESYSGRSYTSARLKTAGKFEHDYGRYEARLKLPSGQGIWPAFWMLGADIGTTPWPDCGEIDIMENIGKEPTLVHGTLHGPGYSGGSSIGKSYELPSKAAFSADYHVYAIEWERDEVRWYVDGTLYQTRKPGDLPSGTKWVYDHDFFILLNLAVGGQWPGNPDGTTKFPQLLIADYVRVYSRE